jgi:hypothetical protein
MDAVFSASRYLPPLWSYSRFAVEYTVFVNLLFSSENFLDFVLGAWGPMSSTQIISFTCRHEVLGEIRAE